MAAIEFQAIRKTFGAVPVINGVDLSIRDGEFAIFVGPSGCGKTTLLRILAGLEDASSGRVRIGERDVTTVHPKRRNVAMVFQNYALYPHMTVAENIAFGLKVRGIGRAERDAAVCRAAALLGLGALLERRPKQLSGGQRQRVAMGRAIVRDPEAFLMDEPLSNLDAQLRTQMRLEIRELQRRLGATTIYVTHDQVEALTMADRICVLLDGRVQQFGTPDELYDRPANRFVAGFIGAPAMNFLEARRIGQHRFELDGGVTFELPAERQAPVGEADRIVVGVRPEHLQPAATLPAEQPRLCWRAQIGITEPLGAETLLHTRLGTQDLCVKVDRASSAGSGSIVEVGFALASAHLFDARSGRILVA